jgi:putative ABC transport system substrate-binding protein
MTTRRDLIALLGGAAASSGLRPHVAQAQQGKLRTIGFLGVGSPANWSDWTAAFVERLRDLGWIEGRTVAIIYRWAEGRNERFAEMAAELVGMNVDVIVTGGGAVPAAKQATSTIPIVFAVANDPVGAGYVASLPRPGGNVTGLTIQAPDLAGKRIELLREVVPALRTLAVLGNVRNAGAVVEMNEIAATARPLGLELAKLEVSRAADIAPAFEALRGRAEALYVCPDALVVAETIRINTFALAARLPTMYGNRRYLAVGGLISYGPNVVDLFRRAAVHVDKILRGGKPSDIPVEQPTKFELTVNLITARAIGLTVPATVLARADEVIE